jgi:phage shock protein E
MSLKEFVKHNAVVVDVRTAGEFSSGHVAGSVNIPLQELALRLDQVRAMKQPIVLCCASGNRSGQAMLLLKSQGIDCVNGGPWFEVDELKAA